MVTKNHVDGEYETKDQHSEPCYGTCLEQTIHLDDDSYDDDNDDTIYNRLPI